METYKKAESVELGSSYDSKGQADSSQKGGNTDHEEEKKDLFEDQFDNSEKIKVVVLGACGVGKSSLINRLMRSPFNPDIKPTSGYEMSCREYFYKSKKYEVNLWDSFGEERYPQIMKAFFKGACGSIIVIDLNNQTSLAELEIYLNQIKDFILEPCSAILVGNKKDQPRSIKKEDVEAIYLEQTLPYIECSALTNEGVDMILPLLIREINKMMKTKLYSSDNNPLWSISMNFGKGKLQQISTDGLDLLSNELERKFGSASKKKRREGKKCLIF